MITSSTPPSFPASKPPSVDGPPQRVLPYAERISQLNLSGNTSSLPRELTPTDIINFIWLGTPFTQEQEFSENVLGFKRMFPKMTVILWTSPNPETNVFCSENNIILANVIDKIVKNMKENLKIHYDRAARQIPPNFGMMSDILRYLILFEFGGVYLDVDISPMEQSISKDSSREHLFGNTIPRQNICISSQSIADSDEERNCLKYPFSNDILYSKLTHDPFWTLMIDNLIKTLNSSYPEQLTLRKGTSLTKYREWFTVIASGPGLLWRTIETATNRIGKIPLTPGRRAFSWGAGPVEFAKTYTPSSLTEETDLLNRAIRAVIDELPRGRVKALHYLPLLDKFTHMTPQSAREEFFSVLEEVLKNQPTNATPIDIIFTENDTQHQRLSQAIPKKLNKTQKNDLRATLKILKITGACPNHVSEEDLAQSISQRLKGKSLEKAFKIIVDNRKEQLYIRTGELIRKSDRKECIKLIDFLNRTYPGQLYFY